MWAWGSLRYLPDFGLLETVPCKIAWITHGNGALTYSLCACMHACGSQAAAEALAKSSRSTGHTIAVMSW